MSRLARKGDAILNSGTEEPWVALVGPEIQENLSLRYLAACLARAGFGSEILAFNGERDFSRVVRAIVGARTRPLAVGLSLAFQWRVLRETLPHDRAAVWGRAQSLGYRSRDDGDAFTAVPGLVDGADVIFPLGMRCIRDVEQDVGAAGLLERRAE